ncbi:hypothetical protein TNCV_418931 [Trichonephila clavipes]|uniref:Uncharacterized protein n=1 Tax=Trichonephila clavipes TaxID=2585209 RepID=A0A8X6RZG2_TRICX|nr:hypothetical protein TNCV_418931 [Trichonephila clavipes]
MANVYLVARQPLSSVRRTALPEGHHVEVGYFGPSRLPSSEIAQGSPRSVRKHPISSMEQPTSDRLLRLTQTYPIMPDVMDMIESDID